MTVTALVSGGKDSVYAASLAEGQGWPVDELVVVRPADPDSMMFHTPNLEMVRLQAEAWGKSFRSVTAGGSDESSEMAALTEAATAASGPIVAGAIESSYQWSRLLRVGDAVGRRVYTPLWRKEPSRVVRAEIAAGLDIRLVHLAAEGLTADLLGRQLDLELLAELERRSTAAGLHVAGEGGEYETLVVDAPFFRRRLVLDDVVREEKGSTARLTVRKAHLVEKPGTAPQGRPT